MHPGCRAERRRSVSGDEDGLDAVEQYLRDELPEASIESEPIPGQGFLLRVAAAEFLCDVIVGLDFVREHEIGDIPEILEEWAVVDHVKAGGVVIISGSGVTTDV